MDDERESDGLIVAMNRLNRLQAKEPCGQQSSDEIECRGGLIKPSIDLQDLRLRICATAKAEHRSHNPWRRSCQESLVPEIGPPGSLWRGVETRG
jgi:hypothetical protein